MSPLNNDLLPIPFLDLRVTNQEEIAYMQNSIAAIGTHGRMINGPEVEKFEEVAKQYLDCHYALGVSSGTTSLIAALLALDIGPKDEVILPCLSFIGTASAVSMVGATPIFADIDWNLCINPEKIPPLVTANTKAIMPVHFTGCIAPMEEILQIANLYGIGVIEDAAPSFGAELGGKKAGTFGNIGCFSMNPMKILGAWGEGGLIVTNTEKLYHRLKQLRYHNILDKELCFGRGLNARLNGIQAASLTYRLKNLDNNLKRRHQIAKRYNEAFKDYVKTPTVNDIAQHVYYTYSILSPERDKLKKHLSNYRIETKIYHSHLMPQHPIYSSHPQHNEIFPIGNLITQQILCLPLHEKMSDIEIEQVIFAVQEYFER